jgi:hypothetical protein
MQDFAVRPAHDGKAMALPENPGEPRDARKYALWDAGKRLDPSNYKPDKLCSRLSTGPKIQIAAPFSDSDLICRKKPIPRQGYFLVVHCVESCHDH